MKEDKEENKGPAGKQVHFPMTNWPLILNKNLRPECLKELAEKYRYPLYCFFLYKDSVETAEDLVQDVFMELQISPALDHVDPQKGRFRTYLLAIAKNIRRKHYSIEKRRPEIHATRIDWSDADERLRLCDNKPLDEDDAFRTAWSANIVRLARQKLAEHYLNPKQTVKNEEKQKSREDGFYAWENRTLLNKEISEIARELNREPEWVRDKNSRLNEKFRDFLQSVVLETLRENDNLREELEFLGLTKFLK